MIWRIFRRLATFVLLTIVTQVGGLIYLLYYPLGQFIRKRYNNKWQQRGLRLAAFSLLMIVSSLVIVPAIASVFGRVPLPLASTEKQALKPGSWFFVLANRHYVKPELKQSLLDAASSLVKDYPGAELVYLDANFPFFTGFPLLPHLSHDDGEKADLAFVYQKTGTKLYQNRTATWLGYGFFEAPPPGVIDMPGQCERKGYWQYSLLGKFAGKHPDFHFYPPANTCLLKALARDKQVGKIFIEPHLKLKLGLHPVKKVRFHGCQAVRHDDHIHVQL